MKIKLVMAIILIAIAVNNIVSAEPGLPFDLSFEGTGTEFILKDNPVYPNLKITSSEDIYIFVQAVTNTVSFHIEAVTTTKKTETIITISGVDFTSFPRFLHQDGFFISELKPSDEGEISWTQDLKSKHHIYLLPKSSTINIWGKNDPRDEVVSKGIGIWLDATTCQLTKDIAEDIVIQANNITLDGNNKNIIGPGYGYGIYLYGRTGVTVKNCTVQNFNGGIYLVSSSGNTLTDNTVVSNIGTGINLYPDSSGNILTANTTISNYRGIVIAYSSGNELNKNNINSNTYAGIDMQYVSNCTLTNNTINGPSQYFGVYLARSSNNTLTNNTLNANVIGIPLYYSSNTVYHNNIYGSTYYNVYSYDNQPAELSYNYQGNWWGHTTAPGFYIYGGIYTPYDSNRADVIDTYPYLVKDGWLKGYAPGQPEIPPDLTPPTGSITINAGQEYTSSTAVSLTLIASDPESGVSQMRLSNDNITWTDWLAYSGITDWNLETGDGAKTVWVEYKNGAGLVSTFSDTIILDTTPPTGSISINAGALSTSSTAVSLTLSASDTLSGVTEMCFSNDEITWSPWEAYTTSKEWILTEGDGNKTVWVEYKDGAGLTAVFSDTIILDTTPPTGSILINNDISYTNNAIVNLTLSAQDPESDVSKMRFSNDIITWSDEENYTTSKTWALSAGDGNKTVWVEYKDGAGLTAVFSDTIILDITLPVISATLNPLPNIYGWNNSDVIVTFSAQDVLSGIESVTPPVPVVTEGSGQVVTGTAVDRAGNSASTTATVNLDRTAPETIITAIFPNPTNVTPTLTVQASDNLSNIQSIEYRLDEGSWIAMDISGSSAGKTTGSAQIPIAGLSDGVHTVYARALDFAGNWDLTPAEKQFTLDTTPPQITVTPLRTQEYLSVAKLKLTLTSINGKEVSVWMTNATEEQTLVITIADATSGISQVTAYLDNSLVNFGTYINLSTYFLGEHTIKIVATDNVGLSSEASVVINIITSVQALQEIVTDLKAIIADPATSPQVDAMLTNALEVLIGNNNGAGNNGALDKLSQGDLIAGFVKIWQAIRQFQKTTDKTGYDTTALQKGTCSLVQQIVAARLDVLKANGYFGYKVGDPEWSKVLDIETFYNSAMTYYNAGNYADAAKQFKQAQQRISEVDKWGPEVRFSTPTDGQWLNTATPEIIIEYRDFLTSIRIDLIKIWVDGVDCTSYAQITDARLYIQQFPFALAEGQHTIIVSVTDSSDYQYDTASGGQTTVVPITVYVDTTPPNLAIDYPTEGLSITNLTQLYFNVSYNDLSGVSSSGIDETSLKILLNTVDITVVFTRTGSATYYPGALTSEEIAKFWVVYDALKDGLNELKVDIKDKIGNIAQKTRGFYVTVGTIEPPAPPALKIELEIIGGNDQSGLVGRSARDPLIVRAFGGLPYQPARALEGIPLLFEITQGGGIFTEQEGYSTVTNAQGEGGLHYLYGSTAGRNKVKVSVLGDTSVTPVEFYLIGLLPVFTKYSGDGQQPYTLYIQETGETITEWFLEGTSLRQSFWVWIGDPRGSPVTDTEIAFTVTPTENAYVVPEKVTTDVYGFARCVLVMEKEGTYTVEARAVEFPDIAPLAFTPMECKKLPQKTFDSNDLTQIVQAGVPVIALVKSGQAQIGGSETTLASPLVVEARNMFGQVPLSKSEVDNLLRQRYARILAGTDIRLVNVDFWVDVYVGFVREEGDGDFEGAPGSSIVWVRLSQWNRGEAQVRFTRKIFKLNIIGSYMTDKYGCNLEFEDTNPYGGWEISQVPKPALYNFGGQNGSYFVISPPEINMVTQNELGQYVRIPSIMTTDPANIVPYSDYQIEVKAPVNAAPTLNINSVDARGNTLTTYDGAIGNLNLRNIPMQRIEANDRYALWRTPKRLLATTKTLLPGVVITGEPAPGYDLMQMTPYGSLEPTVSCSPEEVKIKIKRVSLNHKGKSPQKESRELIYPDIPVELYLAGDDIKSVSKCRWNFNDGSQIQETKNTASVTHDFNMGTTGEYRRKNFEVKVDIEYVDNYNYIVKRPFTTVVRIASTENIGTALPSKSQSGLDEVKNSMIYKWTEYLPYPYDEFGSTPKTFDNYDENIPQEKKYKNDGIQQYGVMPSKGFRLLYTDAEKVAKEYYGIALTQRYLSDADGQVILKVYGALITASAWDYKREELEGHIDHERQHIRRFANMKYDPNTLDAKLTQYILGLQNYKTHYYIYDKLLLDYEHADIFQNDMVSPNFSYKFLQEQKTNRETKIVLGYCYAKRYFLDGEPCPYGLEKLPSINLPSETKTLLRNYLLNIYNSTIAFFPEFLELEGRTETSMIYFKNLFLHPDIKEK